MHVLLVLRLGEDQKPSVAKPVVRHGGMRRPAEGLGHLAHGDRLAGGALDPVELVEHLVVGGRGQVALAVGVEGLDPLPLPPLVQLLLPRLEEARLLLLDRLEEAAELLRGLVFFVVLFLLENKL